MSVERLPHIPSPSSASKEVSTPVCRPSLIRGIEILGRVTADCTTEQADILFEDANDTLVGFARHTTTASEDDCASCLEGAGIACPGKAQQAQEEYTLLRLRGLEPVAERRLLKVAREGGTRTNPLNRILALELQQKGFPQNIEALPLPVEVNSPVIQVVADPRPPARREQELLEEFKEPRPSCAVLFANFIEDRKTAISKWKERNIKKGLKKDEWSKLNLTEAEKSYFKAIEHAENATEEDCSKCLGENCPLRHAISWESFVEITTHDEREDGYKFKTLPRILNILRGLPWSKLVNPPNPKTLRSHIMKQLARLANGQKEDI